MVSQVQDRLSGHFDSAVRSVGLITAGPLDEFSNLSNSPNPSSTQLRVLNAVRRRSPFVVEMLASFQNGSHVFILTEFVPGGELFNVINVLGHGQGEGTTQTENILDHVKVVTSYIVENVHHTLEIVCRVTRYRVAL